MPTIRRCCIVGCKSNSRQNHQLQFFQFPKPENPFHKLWKQACYASLNRILPFKKPVVCALHFQPNCIGGRRLTSSAVPTLRLEVPSNLKAEEQQAMIDEIERSRKCAYINAVVYEWLVRANLNPQLRGSITHGMIKEKADTTKGIIGCDSFAADNRWLNRFRESHLTGFAQKLATNQLKPLGMSLWINDIVQDLENSFPPTSADSMAKLESVPEQYMDYMQQYGEYEEEDDQDCRDISKNQSYQDQEHNQSDYDSYGQSQQEYDYEDDCYYDRQQNNQNRNSPYHQNSIKRIRLQENDDVIANGNSRMSEDFTEVHDVNHNSNSCHSNSSSHPSNNNMKSKTSNANLANGSPKHFIKTEQTNGHTSDELTPSCSTKEIESYTQALEYLKPLEEFALLKENFRAIGLISQLEMILSKGDCIIGDANE